MDIRSAFATHTYGQTRSTTATSPASDKPAADGTGFTELIGDFARTLRAGEETAKSAMTGGADAHALVEALASSELAVETAVTLRDKVVEAYQEILRMQV